MEPTASPVRSIPVTYLIFDTIAETGTDPIAGAFFMTLGNRIWVGEGAIDLQAGDNVKITITRINRDAHT